MHFSIAFDQAESRLRSYLKQGPATRSSTGVTDTLPAVPLNAPSPAATLATLSPAAPSPCSADRVMELPSANWMLARQVIFEVVPVSTTLVVCVVRRRGCGRAACCWGAAACPAHPPCPAGRQAVPCWGQPGGHAQRQECHGLLSRSPGLPTAHQTSTAPSRSGRGREVRSAPACTRTAAAPEGPRSAGGCRKPGLAPPSAPPVPAHQTGRPRR